MLHSIFCYFIKLLNYLFVKHTNEYLIYPHGNCKNDNYDLLNYSSDNALCLLRAMLNDDRFTSYKFSVVCYNKNKINDYIKCCEQLKNNNVVFILPKSISFIYRFFRASCIITDTPFHAFSYKTKKQKIICLGYYTPFKDDFGHIKEKTFPQKKRLFSYYNRQINSHITTSDIASRIIATDFLMIYSNFHSLGFPRNDIFYNNHVQNICRNNLYEVIQMNPRFIIVYTPTFRDYEHHSNEMRTIFGDVDDCWMKKLENYLVEVDAIIIAKLHPMQEKGIIKADEYNRIKLFSDLTSKINISLYDILSISDSLITDYTSTSFDYMHLHKPIIYYMYDYNRYKETRGFSLNPIESLCGGEIVYTFDDLFNAIKNTLEKDEYCTKREFIHDLVNEHHDGCSTKRVMDFVYKKEF